MRSIVVLVSLLTSLSFGLSFGPGCTRPEPLFDVGSRFDGGTIGEDDAPSSENDAPGLDAFVPDDAPSGNDAPASDAPGPPVDAPMASTDAGRDAGRDSGTDAGRTDAGRTDAGRDGGPVDGGGCTASEGLCNNGRDDDCDGDVDCLDVDCELRPICDPTCGGEPCP